MIVVVDYGLGNIGAIVNILDYLGYSAVVSHDTNEIRNASHIILPGVGSFDRGMQGLKKLNLVRPLTEAVLDRKIPLLGVCLGMQLLGESSEEGEEAGLGWISARSKRIPQLAQSKLKIPHIGWTDVKRKNDSLLLQSGVDERRFYFVHSYYMDCSNSQDIAATCHYGSEFCCAVSRENIHGVQFHPEKSHRYGMELFHRFLGHC